MPLVLICFFCFYLQGCELEPIFGQCGLTGGPSGPFKYFQHDFPQPPFCSGQTRTVPLPPSFSGQNRTFPLPPFCSGKSRTIPLPPFCSGKKEQFRCSFLQRKEQNLSWPLNWIFPSLTVHRLVVVVFLLDCLWGTSKLSQCLTSGRLRISAQLFTNSMQRTINSKTVCYRYQEGIMYYKITVDFLCYLSINNKAYMDKISIYVPSNIFTVNSASCSQQQAKAHSRLGKSLDLFRIKVKNYRRSSPIVLNLLFKELPMQLTNAHKSMFCIIKLQLIVKWRI